MFQFGRFFFNMRLITHNMLHSAHKRGVSVGYPLKLLITSLDFINYEMNVKFLGYRLPELHWAAFYSAVLSVQSHLQPENVIVTATATTSATVITSKTVTASNSNNANESKTETETEAKSETKTEAEADTENKNDTDANSTSNTTSNKTNTNTTSTSTPISEAETKYNQKLQSKMKWLKEYEFPAVFDAKLLTDEDFLQACHYALLEIQITSGFLQCPESGRKFPIIDGIPNMLLREDELPNTNDTNDTNDVAMATSNTEIKNSNNDSKGNSNSNKTTVTSSIVSSVGTNEARNKMETEDNQNADQNPYMDDTLLKSVEKFKPESNQQFIDKYDSKNKNDTAK